MFSDFASELITIAVQAFFITVAGWIAVFAWQDIGGVENFIFRRRNMRNVQKGRRKPKQNKITSRADSF